MLKQKKQSLINAIASTPVLPRLMTVSAMTLALSLTACGGGGGSNTPADPGKNNTETPSSSNTNDKVTAENPNDNQEDTQGGDSETPVEELPKDEQPEESKEENKEEEKTVEKLTGPEVYAQTILPLVEENCSACHAEGPGSPSFAHPDADTAYRALLDNQKVDLNRIEESRIAIRLKDDKHFCWTDCDQDYVTMMNAIEEFMALAKLNEVIGQQEEKTILESGALRMSDGQEREIQRYDSNIIARYEFLTGTGEVAMDTSNVMPALDLALSGVEWVGGGGIKVVSGKAQGTVANSRKLYDRIADPVEGTQEYSVEAWIVPDNVDQEGPARIISYSLNTSTRNFTLGQTLYNYDFRNANLSGMSSANGTPALATADADMDLQAALQHVVITYDQLEGRRIYVNGSFTDDVDAIAPALLNWNPAYQFVLGNEVTDNRLWQGELRFVAVYEEALGAQEVQQNFDAGVGTKLVLRFDIGLVSGIPGAYIQMEAQEFDEHSYFIKEPTIIMPQAAELPIRNMRIAINGEVPVAGQVYKNLDVEVTENNQLISRMGMIIPKDKGVEVDEFSLIFERIGTQENVEVKEDIPMPPVIGNDDMVQQSVGLKTFERINKTMSVLTGVPTTDAEINTVYTELKQQLPRDAELATFVSANQVGISKLGLEYCDALVDSVPMREAFFGTEFNFEQDSMTAFAAGLDKAMIINALYDNMIGNDLEFQPSRTDVATVLGGLIDDLLAPCGVDKTCDATRTQAIVKASCATLISSAAINIQ